MSAIKKTLREQFQIPGLRPGQEQVIRSLLNGQNTLAIMPTGAGKSLCYQVPALYLTGTTIIVSPLISLMKDQREKMEDFGLEAFEFNSTLSSKKIQENFEKLNAESEDQEQFIYTTPERLENPEFLESLKQISIDFVVIDEAHCVSQWGHDFRPAYLSIARFLKEIGQPPVLALTATATPEVVEDIQKQLDLKDLKVFRAGLERDNLFLEAQHFENEDQKKEALLHFLKEHQGSGIIYAATVKAVEEIHEFLSENSIDSLMYHGKLKASLREQNQNEFMNNSPRLMVATNAFGMGIDKSDIRFVVHFHFPGSLEAYYQEAGRAGRDGEFSDCLLMYLKKDKSTQSLFLARKYPTMEELTLLYRSLQRQTQKGTKAVAKADIETELKVPSRKLAVLLSFLKQLEVVKEPKRGHYRLVQQNLNEAQLLHISDSYRERTEKDQAKLKQVIIYAQSALCRWKMMMDYFQEETEWTHCHHCDNCLHPVVDEKNQLLEPH